MFWIWKLAWYLGFHLATVAQAIWCIGDYHSCQRALQRTASTCKPSRYSPWSIHFNAFIELCRGYTAGKLHLSRNIKKDWVPCIRFWLQVEKCIPVSFFALYCIRPLCWHCICKKKCSTWSCTWRIVFGCCATGVWKMSLSWKLCHD